MGELLDLFERDFSTDILALTNIGKRISGNKEVMIHFIGNIPAVYTDCKFIYLPNKFKTDIKAAQGLVAHESGHIGYGSFELGFIKLIDSLAKKHVLPPLFIKNLVNVLEDVRINAINSIKFPGFYRNLRLLTIKMLPNLKSNIYSKGDILTYINLYMEDFEDFQNKPKLKIFNLNDKDWEGVSKVKDFLLRSLSPSASIISTDVLCKILKKYFPKEHPNQQQNKNISYNRNLNTINQMEQNSRNKRNNEKTDFDKTSENLIDKLKDTELTPDDLEHLNANSDNLDTKKPEKCKVKNSKKNKHGSDKEMGEENPVSEAEKDDDNEEESIKCKVNMNLDDKEIRNKKLEDSFQPNMDEREFLEELEKNELDLTNQEIPFNDATSLDERSYSKENSKRYEKEKEHKIKNLKIIAELVQKSDNAMQERLLTLEKGKYFINSETGRGKRKVMDTKITSQNMLPDPMSYAQIKANHYGIIKKMKLIFEDLKNKAALDTFQKKGRLNNKFIKAVTSDYQFKQCFTKKITNKNLRLLLIVDISGSMRGIKIRAAKIAMVMLYEALEDLAKIRIVLFTGGYDALNIMVKDFEEKLNPRHFDKFGCHSSYCQNLDGVSIKYEADKLEKQDIIVVISDGQPSADGGYSLLDAIPDIHYVRKKFRVFAFSIDSNGDYLNKLYGKDWILTSSRNELELGNKMIKFCQIIVKEFYR